MRLISIFLIFSAFAHGVTLENSDFFNYDVFFTNPVCDEYKYDEAVYSISGELIDSKPKNVYCKRGDFSNNSERKNSPHYNIIKLINDKNVNELFLTFLSFSNKDVADALCDAIKRNVKISFIIDSNNEDRRNADRYLKMLSKCRPENVPANTEINIPQTFFKGNTRGLGYAHNKVILAKYQDSKKVKIVYGSGNMSSGTILHHENWHFVTTNEETYFYQAHVCLKDGMLNHSDSKSAYKKYIDKCRKTIQYPKETDIDFFIVPSDGKVAMKNIVKNIEKAKSVDVAVHRFTHTDMIKALVKAGKKGKEVNLIADDDIYWTGVLDEQIGSNMFFEYHNIIKVVRADVEVKYMETNQNSHLLHHNKYIVFNYADGSGAVHAGAGNFTKAAFTKNLENFYFIKIPSVVNKFKRQYNYMFYKLATAYVDMPVQYVMP